MKLALHSYILYQALIWQGWLI